MTYSTAIAACLRVSRTRLYLTQGQLAERSRFSFSDLCTGSASPTCNPTSSYLMR